MAVAKLGFTVICSGIVFALLMVYTAWSVLEPWEIGLDYSIITQSIGEEAWGSGRHYIGIGHSFLRFNSTVTTVLFAHDSKDASGGPLRSRTQDGLEVMLELSFQYVLDPTTLYKMYTQYGKAYHSIFIKMGMDLLTVAATKHTARAFFQNRTMIGNMMEETLRSHFKTNAYVDVPLFQFQAVTLPPDFEAAIKATQVAEQQIKRMTAEQHTLLVEYETGVIQAQRYVQVRKQQADAIAQSIALKNAADIASYNASQLYAAEAFVKVLDLFDGNVEQLIEYIKVRAVRDHPGEHSVLAIGAPSA